MQIKDFTKKLQTASEAEKEAVVGNIQNIVMPDSYINQFKLLRDLRRGMNLVKIVTPVNYDAERAAFLEDPTGHPIFEYDKNLLAEISSVFEDEGKFLWKDHQKPYSTLTGLLISLLENRVRDVCATAEFVSAMEQKSPHWQNQLMLEKYGDVDPDLSFAATEFLDELISPEDFAPESKPPRNEHIEAGLALMSFDAAGIKEKFEFALGEYGFDDIPVEITGDYKFVTVNYQPEICVYIPEDIQVSGIRLMELIRHEIECHVRDFMNSEYLFRPYGTKCGLGSIDGSDILTEGHALLEEDKLHQYYFGRSKKPVPWYVLAIDYARGDMSFCEVVEKLKRHFADCNYLGDQTALAWRYAYRVFRGSSNTFRSLSEEPFVFTKDKSYLEGYLLAKELDAAGLGYWLEIGGFRPSELLEIADVANFSPLAIPYKDKNVTFKIYRSLLNTLELEGLV